MKGNIFSGCLFLLLITLALPVSANKVKIVNFSHVKQLLNTKNDTTYVINFWATWCVPCRTELPYFEKINKIYSNNKFKLVLISLDFPSKIESGLIPFIKANELKAEIWLLDEKDPNTWIDTVNKTWSGAIPATVIYNKNSNQFYEKAFEFEELNSIIKNTIIN